jgi:hypothetical protein
MKDYVLTSKTNGGRTTVFLAVCVAFLLLTISQIPISLCTRRFWDLHCCKPRHNSGKSWECANLISSFGGTPTKERRSASTLHGEMVGRIVILAERINLAKPSLKLIPFCLRPVTSCRTFQSGCVVVARGCVRAGLDCTQ